MTLGGQQRLLDVSTFNTWIQAKYEGQDELAALYVRRFSDEFKVAFDAWLKTNPFSNPNAPPGPSFMPEYRNPQIMQGAATNHEASRVFDEGTAARKQSEEYTGTTVVLATVLFLVALSPRFRSRRVRFALLLLTGGLAVYARDHRRVPSPVRPPRSIDGLDGHTSVNKQGVNDPQVDQDQSDHPNG